MSIDCYLIWTLLHNLSTFLPEHQTRSVIGFRPNNSQINGECGQFVDLQLPEKMVVWIAIS